MASLLRGIEIERKFIIEKPDLAMLSSLPDYTKSDIEQIYLKSEENVTRRIRRRVMGESIRYYETVKRRINAMSAVEDEGEIAASEYDTLKAEIDTETRPIIKTRHTFSYLERTVEIDIYPEWERAAILEVELPSCDTELTLPPFIRVIREVTGIKAYSNASMSRRFPDEP